MNLFKNLFKKTNKLEEIKKGNQKYESYFLNNEDFIKECKTGLFYSIVRIKGEIYELEVQLDEVCSEDYDNFICYINDTEIKGLNNFLNYDLGNNTYLKDLTTIEFIEYNNTDPKKYFVDGII